MLVSTKGRYALRVLVDLAEHSGEGYVPLKIIAAREDISEKYLESILKSLVQDKILTGLRGKGGGYKLAVPPHALSVGRVLRLSEPSLATVNCLTENAEQCPRSGECRTLPMWKELDSMILGYLDGKTIADLARSNGGEAGPE